MKHSTFILLAGIAALTTWAGNPEFKIVTSAILKDGSILKADFLNDEIMGSTAFVKELKLKPEIIQSLNFKGTNGAARATLVNSDSFAMTVSDEAYKIATALGDLAVPVKNLHSLSFTKVPLYRESNDGLVFYCTFDDETSLATPVVGPAMKLELGQIRTHEGKNGGALFVNPGVAGAVVKLPQGTLATEGCIEFWANMASGKTEFSTGGDPNYFAIYTDDGIFGGALGFASNDGVSNSGLCGYFFGIRAYSNSGYTHMMPYSDVFKGEDYNGWHHYAFTWTSTSLSLYIDGKRVAHANGQLNTELLVKGDITLAIPLHRTLGKSFNNKSAIFLDELKIWNYAKTSFDL